MASRFDPSHEPTGPHPPRFWWLKRISIAVALLLLGLGGLRWEWEHAAERRTRAIVDAAHARGEPILPQDFAPATIPDTENAAVTLQQAADAIVTDTNSDWMDSLKWNGEMTPAVIARTDRIAVNNATALRLARRARSQPRADWGLAIRSPVIMMQNLPLRSQRELAKLQQWVALGDHSKGNDRKALDHVLDLLRQADAIEQGPFVVLVTSLSADGLEELSSELVQRISPDLKIVDAPPQASTALNAADRRQVQAVIASLLDETRFHAASLRAWEGERMMTLDATEYIAQGTSPLASQPLAWLIKPMILLDGNRMATDLTQARLAAGLADKPAAEAAFAKRDDRDITELGWAVHLQSRAFAHPLARLMGSRFQALTERRAAAIELAIRLYRVDHAGRWPAALSELVPDYLSAVPADPMAADSRPFGYRPAATPPVLYSVGENGIDDGGTSLPGQRYRWALPDAVFPLLPEAPSTQPASAETEDDQ